MKDPVDNPPLVSVILPVYNEDPVWLGLAMESILNQSYTAFELIIVLDGIEREDLREEILLYHKKDPRVHVVENGTWLGLARSLNAGAAHARGKYLARMDADDIAFPDRLERQVMYMEVHAELATVGCQVEKINEAGEVIGRSDNPVPASLCRKMAAYVNIATHPSMIIRREVFEAIGGYRPLPSGEDYDLLLRLLSQGYQVANMPEMLMQYRIRSGSITNANSVIQKICFKYVQLLYRQRLASGKDTYDPGMIEGQIKSVSVSTIEKQNKAQMLLQQARSNWNAGKKLRGLFLLIQSFLVSPIQRRYYLDWVRAEVIRMTSPSETK